MKGCGYGDNRVWWGTVVALVGPEVSPVAPVARLAPIARFALVICQERCMVPGT